MRELSFEDGIIIHLFPHIPNSSINNHLDRLSFSLVCRVCYVYGYKIIEIMIVSQKCRNTNAVNCVAIMTQLCHKICSKCVVNYLRQGFLLGFLLQMYVSYTFVTNCNVANTDFSSSDNCIQTLFLYFLIITRSLGGCITYIFPGFDKSET